MNQTNKLKNIIGIACFYDNKLKKYVQLAIWRGSVLGMEQFYRRVSNGSVTFPCGRTKTAEEWDAEFGEWVPGRLLQPEHRNALVKFHELAKQACEDREKARKLIDSKETFSQIEAWNIQALMSDKQDEANREFRRAWCELYHDRLS